MSGIVIGFPVLFQVLFHLFHRMYRMGISKKLTAFFLIKAFADSFDCFVGIRLQLGQLMNHQTRTELRLKPSGFRRHNITAIGNVDQLLHGHGI